MARANLEALIERIRTLTGVGEEFTDDEIAQLLDATRTYHREEALHPDDPYVSDPTVWIAREDAWEDGYVLQDGQGNVLSEATSGDVSEPVLGRFVLATAADPVTITGRTYDIYGASAELLMSWAARVSRDFDFSADGQSFSRSQKREGLLEMAREFAKRAKPRRAKLVRPDEAS